ncbi:endonuclease/exonuclease/phosphatase family protein [Verrucosispora sp. CWR15]|uniref:Endonuclease/exonuclease/phosphatase family protein n=1 Tax=Verrucosispora sioxanthis TaxID=2499994 RepID=A0A6M1L0P7_9ACTN|nr:endonuclease/exonuclease/phosphatase family protein [Verrucosispora sioxanthis]NEE62481.1 endonuclease/exonuclease/phosphatase family protein [Verrucosispora sioxanthis]NGM11591.1 endonuclease/exonuclease/phosphatase family protein [Verrucosispora sioxanthis]
MLRVMTWNIRTGGRDRGGPDRRELVARVVAGQRPDVLALQELGGLDVAGFAGDVELRPYLARSWFGQPVAVLVRAPWPVLAAAPVRRPFHHAAQRVVVGTAAGPLTVLGTHLDPYSGTRRLVEAGWAAGAVRTDRDGLALLAGDLNTLDPYAEHADRVGRLPPGYRRRHLRRDGRTVETRAVARLLAAGLVDLGADAGPTVPTAHGGAEFPDVRLDYLLATPTLATHLTHVEVVRTPHTDHASDHYPLVAEFALTPPAAVTGAG